MRLKRQPGDGGFQNILSSGQGRGLEYKGEEGIYRKAEESLGKQSLPCSAEKLLRYKGMYGESALPGTGPPSSVNLGS